MSGWLHASDTIDDYIAIGERVAADPRYQQLRAAMAHRIRAYTRNLIRDTSVSDDEYHRRTSSYDLEQFKAFLRETEFLYTQAREALAAAGELGKAPATPTTSHGTAELTPAAPGASAKAKGSWSDGFYENSTYMAARAAMATRIRQYALVLIDNPAVSDDQFHHLTSEFGYQQTRQLFTETILALGANPPA